MNRLIAIWLVLHALLNCSSLHAAQFSVKSVIVVAGNFSLNGELSNIAQYDLETNSWSNNENLYIYGEANGLISDIAMDTSNELYDKLFVAGSFDTERITSQIQLCSVGAYDGLKRDGLAFNKIGEGLCPSKDSTSNVRMEIYTTVMGNNGDLFVGGSFESRVWDGNDFVDVYHLARFDVYLASWFPLSAGQLRCIERPSTLSKVNSLAWDAANEVLYLGGVFDAVDYRIVTTGLLLWTKTAGLVSFPGGGVGNYINGPSDAFVKAIAYDAGTQSLFVSGYFQYVGTVYCPYIAVWQSNANRWLCLYSESYGISTVTSMLVSSNHLYLSGWTSPRSTWDGRDWQSPYAIARFDLEGYVQESKLNSSRGASRTVNGRVEFDIDDIGTKSTPSSSNNKSRYLLARVVRNMSLTVDSRRISNEGVQMNISLGSNEEYGRLGLLTGQQSQYWTPRWEWLPGFSGGNGPIFRMTEGTGLYSDSVFIAGAFNNYPPLIMWKPHYSGKNNATITGSVTSIKGDVSLVGLITAVVQADLLFDVIPTPDPIQPVVPVIDYTVPIVVGFVAVGVLIVLASFAWTFLSRRGYIPLPDSRDLLY